MPELAAPEVHDDELLDAAVEEARPIVAATKPKPFGILFWCCVGWLALLVFGAVFANLLPLKDPFASDFLGSGIDAHPSMAHWLGTDDLARDIFSRFIFGARLSLIIGVCATVIGISIGGGLGMLTAYRGGRFDSTMSLFMYSGLAFPAIIAVLAILAFWGKSVVHITIVLGLFSVPLIFRLVRASTLACVTREYVTAAKSQGASSARVLMRDIFPNVAPSLIAYSIFTLGGIIVTEGALAFLGQSVAPPTATWGTMISEASSLDSSNLSLILAPAMGLFLTLVSLNIIGERIRVRFDTGESRL